MKRIIITAAALAAAIPASLGLMGNASFAQSVQVRVPAHAILLPAQSKHVEIGDDHGGLSAHVEPGDDKGGASAHVEPGDDKGGASAHVEPGDDKGGATAHVEPGDDKGGLNSTQIQASNDKVSTSTSGKADDGAKVDVKGGKDDGSGHQ
jgi:hypothetical protein